MMIDASKKHLMKHMESAMDSVASSVVEATQRKPRSSSTSNCAADILLSFTEGDSSEDLWNSDSIDLIMSATEDQPTGGSARPLQRQLSRRRSLGSSRSLMSRRRSSCGTTTSAASSSSGSVRFGFITVREYPQILSMNPACSEGPSLSIDWNYLEHQPLTVRDFESIRKRRKNRKTLVISKNDRVDRLKRMGYTDEELMICSGALRKAQEERAQTIATMGRSRIDAAFEKVTKKMSTFMLQIGPSAA